MKKIAAGLLILFLLITSSSLFLTTPAQGIPPLPPDPCSGVTEIPLTECNALVSLYTSTNGSSWTIRTDWLVTSTPCSWYGVTCSAGHVQQIFLGTNGLSGGLPAAIGFLTELEVLNLGENQIDGTIMLELGNLSKLQNLFLNSNQLSGSIPTVLGSLLNLQQINLGSNQLTGSIPSELGNLTNLEWLNLENNQLNGGLPLELGSLVKLQFLNIAKNQLSGPIPNQLGDLTNLEGLDVSNNAFVGEVPAAIKQLSKLKILDTQFDYNGLYATDPTVAAFLTSKDPNWSTNQTIAPANLQAAPSAEGVRLTWTPIPYSEGGGYYEIGCSTTLTGTYTIKGLTADKNAPSYTINGLNPNSIYYFRLRTFTPKHDVQQNDLWSAYAYSSGVKTYTKLFLPQVLKQP